MANPNSPSPPPPHPPAYLKARIKLSSSKSLTRLVTLPVANRGLDSFPSSLALESSDEASSPSATSSSPHVNVTLTRSDVESCLEPLMPRLATPVRQAAVLADICLQGDANPDVRERINMEIQGRGGKDSGRKAFRAREKANKGKRRERANDKAYMLYALTLDNSYLVLLTSSPTHALVPLSLCQSVQGLEASGGIKNRNVNEIAEGRPRSPSVAPRDTLRRRHENSNGVQLGVQVDGLAAYVFKVLPASGRSFSRLRCTSWFARRIIRRRAGR